VEPIHAVQGIFRIQGRVLCPGAADVNRDQEINMADPIALLSHLFRGAPLEDVDVDCMSASR